LFSLSPQGRTRKYEQKSGSDDAKRLSGKLEAALDPCAAIQVAFDLSDGQEGKIGTEK
jgi:hypothetical protein